jgi:hypothetical protein
MRRGLFVAALVFVILLIGWFAYRFSNREAFVAQGPLPVPPSGQIPFAGTAPPHSFSLEEGNILSRTVFEASGPSSSHIEVRDLMLPPHAVSHLAALHGPVLVEVYSGEGTLSLGEKDGKGEAVVAGNVRSVAAGQALAFDNQGSLPLVVRLYLFEAK